MKKIFSLMILSLLVVSMIGVVSAKTVIMGTIYNEDYSAKIGDVNITIACFHGEDINYRYITSISSGDSIGDYAVYFPEIGEGACNGGDSVTVTAIKDDLSGTDTEIVVDNMILDLDVAIINIPMVPEFGIFVGILTLFGALGVFFMIRRE